MSTSNYRKCAKCGRIRAEDMTVTYHRFPCPGTTNIVKARAWAIYCWPNQDWTSVEQLQSLHKSCKVLCGRHFNSTQFYDNDRQKLSKFAVPDSIEVEELLNERENVFNEIIDHSSVTGQHYMLRKPDSQIDNIQTESSTSTESTLQCSEELVMSESTYNKQFCMICLDTSEACRLYPANKYNLEMEFQHLTGLSLQGETHIRPQFCTECAQRLSNCSKFRNKCLTAYHLLLELVEVNELTAQNIASLSRLNNLTSSIGKKTFEPNHYDLYLIHTEEQDQEIQQELPKNKAIKIGVKSVNDKVNLNPLPENEDIYYELKPEIVDDFQTNVEYLEDIDVDIDINIERDLTEKIDKCKSDVINDMDNNCIYLRDRNSDNDLDSDVVNNEFHTENVKVTTVTCTEGKIKVTQISKKPKSKGKNLKESKEPKSKSKNLKESKKSSEVYNRELSKGTVKVTKLLHEEQLADIQKRKNLADIQKRKNLARFKTAPYEMYDVLHRIP